MVNDDGKNNGTAHIGREEKEYKRSKKKISVGFICIFYWFNYLETFWLFI